MRLVPRKLTPRWVNTGLAVLLVGSGFGAWAALREPEPVSATTERTVVVSRSTVTATVSGTGNVESAASTTVDFSSGGTLTTVYVEAGDTVRKGQKLAAIDPSDAERALASARADLLAAQEAYDEVTAGRTGVEAANYNSGEQTVLSGERDRIADAGRVALELGAKRAITLNVAGAYHSSLMSSAAARLEEYLGGVAFQAPKIPVLSNVTGGPHGDDPAGIRRLMVRQVTSSVRWVECVGWLRGRGVTRYVECGPGRVLSGLVKRMDPESAVLNVQDIASLDKTAAAVSAG